MIDIKDLKTPKEVSDYLEYMRKQLAYELKGNFGLIRNISNAQKEKLIDNRKSNIAIIESHLIDMK